MATSTLQMQQSSALLTAMEFHMYTYAYIESISTSKLFERKQNQKTTIAIRGNCQTVSPYILPIRIV